MAGYVLYIPEGSSCTESEPCLQALRNTIYSADVLTVRRGPDGGAGTLMGWKQGDVNRDPLVGITEDQVWKPSPESKREKRPKGHYWIGWEQSRPVEPLDIYRFPENGGYYSAHVQLQDENHWLVPVATRFPKTMRMVDGTPQRVVSAKYQAFHDKAFQYVDGLVQSFDYENPSDIEIPIADGYYFAIEALQMNYRINEDVVDCLQLFEDKNVGQIICTVAEAYDIADCIKEKKTDERLVLVDS